MIKVYDHTSLNIAPFKSGLYVVAVSGGIDSMVLLDILRRRPDLKLIVAHVNHGTRADNHKDRELVHSVCMSHNIHMEYTELNLGPGISEAKARCARYDFLNQCRKTYQASAIITAHHLDDLVETALINIYRGTGRHGLSPMIDSKIVRPLLWNDKNQIRHYAKEHGIVWREDSTNEDTNYLRNFLRKKLENNQNFKNDLIGIIVRHYKINKVIDNNILKWLNEYANFTHNTALLPRYQLVMLPESVALEILRAAYKKTLKVSLTRPQVRKILYFAKSAKSRKVLNINKVAQVRIDNAMVIVERRPGMLS